MDVYFVPYVQIQERVAVADPRFLRGGAQLSGEGNIRFCQISLKTVWNWKNLDPEGARRFQNITM